MITSLQKKHKKNITLFLLFSVGTFIFLWLTPLNNDHYALSLYPIIATFTGALHIQIGSFMIMNYLSYRKNKYLLPLASAFHSSGIFLFIALYVYYSDSVPRSVFFNKIAILYTLRVILTTGLFIVAIYLYKREKSQQKYHNVIVYSVFLWCILHLAVAVSYSINAMSMPLQLINLDTFEWLYPWHGLFIILFISIWVGIVFFILSLTQLKNQFWLSMALVALSNLLIFTIIFKYPYMNSAGWYLARGVECLSSMAVMTVLMSDIFHRFKASRQAYELSYENSVRDPMTRLFNRGYFYNSLSREIKNVTTQKPLSIIFCDIDHFKSVNDTWGHLQGDRVIIKLAELMVSLVREHDIVARIGGEEFAILLPDCHTERAQNIAERIRKQVEQATPATTDGDFPRTITVSLGIISSVDCKMAAEQLADWADRALYMAKNQGRNRAVVFPKELMSQSTEQ
ncbi:GGDEF domain-containing protein [Citrobacter sp. Awk 4]|uniref:sensor domain-containing diguanylate cyclase n=1 Tax=Citrobacter sp. Awk 4 TaxID=2963955 RepID=UPI002302FBC6|nr:GGDEF domain-containing protein [Citrobacter sp. Awk 4]MDA8480003.1 GGDEF domain-containing protein [Citrobacter sp. Awk 4]